MTSAAGPAFESTERGSVGVRLAPGIGHPGRTTSPEDDSRQRRAGRGH
jgi:hypothetical protein